MAIAKRILLFLAVNFLVIFTINIIFSLLGIDPYLRKANISYQSLLIFCFVWGMVGALISLLLSKVMAKWLMGIKMIDPRTANEEERLLLQMVERLCQRAHLTSIPEVGIYQSEEVNAFATGPTKNHSLVAVSTGLLHRLKKEEVEGVLGHEITHIANGDMVTLTLLQGVVNAFVMFLARVLALAVSGLGKKDNQNSNSQYVSFRLFTFLFEFIFMILGSMVIAFFSRFREYRADQGGALLAGKEKMIHALEALKNLKNIQDPAHHKEAIEAFKISTPAKKGFLYLFSTHPLLEDRIERLKMLP